MMAAPLSGQFIVLRISPSPDAPALMRSYSLSGEPSTERYRVSIKREPHGAAGAYIDDKLQAGDVVDVSAARGNFTPDPRDGANCSKCGCGNAAGLLGGYASPRRTDAHGGRGLRIATRL